MGSVFYDLILQVHLAFTLQFVFVKNLFPVARFHLSPLIAGERFPFLSPKYDRQVQIYSKYVILLCRIVFFVLSRCFILHSLPGTRLFFWLIICAAIEKQSSSVYNTHCHCRLLRLVISFCLLLTASRLRKENLRYNDYFNQTIH